MLTRVSTSIGLPGNDTFLALRCNSRHPAASFQLMAFPHPPRFESRSRPLGCSFEAHEAKLPAFDCIYHFHPEIELIAIHRSHGICRLDGQIADSATYRTSTATSRNGTAVVPQSFAGGGGLPRRSCLPRASRLPQKSRVKIKVSGPPVIPESPLGLRHLPLPKLTQFMLGSFSPATAFHVMTKPVGPICNLDCTYCCYLEKEKLFPKSENLRMKPDALKSYIRQYIESQNSPEITFAWQGGESTLLRVGYFRKIVELEKKYAGGRPVHNALQTNGTRLDHEWCRFFGRIFSPSASSLRWGLHFP